MNISIYIWNFTTYEQCFLYQTRFAIDICSWERSFNVGSELLWTGAHNANKITRVPGPIDILIWELC